MLARAVFLNTDGKRVELYGPYLLRQAYGKLGGDDKRPIAVIRDR